MADERIERHPHRYAWRKRFADAKPVMRGEGGSVHSAEGEGAWWLITDEGTMADFLDDEDLGGLVKLRRFDDIHSWPPRPPRCGTSRFAGPSSSTTASGPPSSVRVG